MNKANVFLWAHGHPALDIQLVVGWHDRGGGGTYLTLVDVASVPKMAVPYYLATNSA